MNDNAATNINSDASAINSPVAEVFLTNQKEYSVQVDGTVVGKIFLDYYDQVEKVLFYSALPSQRRLVKELALSHAVQFMIRRPILSSKILALAPERELEEYTCDNLMSFDKIPDSIKSLDDAKLDAYLAPLATVAEGRFTDLVVMLDHLFSELRQDCGIAIGLLGVKRRLPDLIKLTFFCDLEHTFKIWKSANDSSWDNDSRLHITPPYHPVLSGKEEFCLINGDTNSYIGGDEVGINSVFAPEDAILEKSFFGSWPKLNHPFYAEGKTLAIELCPTLCLSQEGYQTLFDFLRAALNQGGSYVAVCGGFNSPYEYVGNILARKGIKSPAGRHGSYDYRGSEANCVWEYRVLEEEGQLTGALLPSWFLPEGWLKIYQNEQPEGTDNDAED